MKRTVPLLITAISGFVLIVAFFVPALEPWGDEVAIWFDILASIAFVLGGGNLLKMHLKKIADQVPGWGYSAVTLLAFIVTLYVGLVKWGVPPSPQQEFIGESFSELPLEDLPESLTFSVPGEIPAHPAGEPLPASVRAQISQVGDQIQFRGWMLPSQQADLINYSQDLKWRCDVTQLFQAAQPQQEALAGKVKYYSDHQALSFQGYMTDEQKAALLALGNTPAWEAAVEQLAQKSHVETSVSAVKPDVVEIPPSLADVVRYDAAANQLTVKGPMSPGQQAALTKQFPITRPLTAEQRQQLLAKITELGPLNDQQKEEFDKFFAASWTLQQLRQLLDEAGVPVDVEKSYCELYEEQKAGQGPLTPTKTVGSNTTLNDEQVAALQEFVDDPKMTVGELSSRLEERGEFTPAQAAVLAGFLSRQPTEGERDKLLAFALLRKGLLDQRQLDLLLEQYRSERAWELSVVRLMNEAHVPKYTWSGQYRAQGTPFWWLYEYAFKPLTATMFAILAFYVASAAFRAFRAKNLEALLLLGTAFIILLGRTFAGVLLTSFIPEDSLFSFWRVENLTVYIMKVFNTAGNRAIMIGIALGIASTSLRVLLGIDRSYLGSGEE